MAIDDVFIKAFRAHRQQGDLFHHDSHQAHELFQTSTIGALMEGVYDGEVTYGELAKHGDFGLGTFNALDGEMIAFDGTFYQMKVDGKAYPVAASAKTPFAVVMRFDPTVKVLWEELTDWAHFQQAVDKAVPSKNIFYAVKVRAVFDYIKVRTVPRQEKPYPPLVEVAKHQPVYVHEGLRGTLVGFRFPDYAQGVNVPGYHVHFLNGERTTGGHVLDFRMRDATVEIDVTSDLHMEVPDCGDFLDADLGKDQAEAIERAEKDR
ncbi:MAG: acetolactate decarboxylase [Nitrospirae bacterium]|nr:MAG: acetolactate decarboxylase [Nitrospirota bacterium]